MKQSNDAPMSVREGSCICGAVRYRVEIDPSQGSRCNCSFCTKLGTLAAIVKPAAFTLVSQPDQLAGYTRTPEVGERFFCRTCHTYCYAQGHLAQVGGDFVSVNLNTLDDHDPSTTQVAYWDGRHDNWEAGPRPTPWPIQA